MTCGQSYTWKVNKQTGKVVIQNAKKGSQVTVTVIARVKASKVNKYGKYLPHGWRMHWKVT